MACPQADLAEALLTAARQSPRPCDFALIAMLGLLSLRIFQATGTDIAGLGEEHGSMIPVSGVRRPEHATDLDSELAEGRAEYRSTAMSAPSRPPHLACS
jgi:hypothetical protein